MWALSSRLIYVLITFFLSVDARSKLLFGWWVRDPNWTIISYQDFTEKRYLRVDLYKSDFMQQPIIKITPTLFAEWAGRRHGWCKYLECERKQQGKKKWFTEEGLASRWPAINIALCRTNGTKVEKQWWLSCPESGVDQCSFCLLWYIYIHFCLLFVTWVKF